MQSSVMYPMHFIISVNWLCMYTVTGSDNKHVKVSIALNQKSIKSRLIRTKHEN